MPQPVCMHYTHRRSGLAAGVSVGAGTTHPRPRLWGNGPHPASLPAAKQPVQHFPDQPNKPPRQVEDASKLCEPGERLTFWQLVRRAQLKDKVGVRASACARGIVRVCLSPPATPKHLRIVCTCLCLQLHALKRADGQAGRVLIWVVITPRMMRMPITCVHTRHAVPRSHPPGASAAARCLHWRPAPPPRPQVLLGYYKLPASVDGGHPLQGGTGAGVRALWWRWCACGDVLSPRHQAKPLLHAAASKLPLAARQAVHLDPAALIDPPPPPPKHLHPHPHTHTHLHTPAGALEMVVNPRGAKARGTPYMWNKGALRQWPLTSCLPFKTPPALLESRPPAPYALPRPPPP